MAGFFENMWPKGGTPPFFPNQGGATPLWPKGGEGFGAAMGEAYPLLLSMGAAMQRGNSPFSGAQQGLAQMMAMDASEEDKRRWEEEMELRRAANARAEAAAARAAAGSGRAASNAALAQRQREEAQALSMAILTGDYGGSAPAAGGSPYDPSSPAAANADMAARNAILKAEGGPTAAGAAALDSIQGGQGDDLLFGGENGDGTAPLSPLAQQIAAYNPRMEGMQAEVFGENPMPQPVQPDTSRLQSVAQAARREAIQPQPQASGGLTPERREMLAQAIMNPAVPAAVKQRAMQLLAPQQAQPKWERFQADDGSVWVYDANNPQNRQQLSGPAHAAPSFRPATPEEAKRYGAEAGQIDTNTGRFYPGEAGQGFMMTLPDGTQVAQGNIDGVKFTEGQAKDNVYATRARGALEVLEPVAGALVDRTDRLAEAVPFGLARGAQNPDFQVATQAGEEFLQAILRKDTGAAITSQEQDMYGKTYLPQPGDGPEILEAKRQARYRAIAAIESGMSPMQQVVKDRALLKSAAEAAAAKGDAAPTAVPGSTPYAGMSAAELAEIDPATLEPADLDAFLEALSAAAKGALQ